MYSDLHIHNARIWTGDPAQPWARSITIRAGRVEALSAAYGRDKPLIIIDAEGKVVAPGLIDSHLHLLTGGESLARLNLSQVRSRDQFEAAIAAHHAMLPHDQWLIANGWSQENWDGTPPDKSWLAAVGDRPVVCYRMDMHAAVVNDAVLARCDLKRDPPGGQIVRDPTTSQPTGLMVEAAAWTLVNPIVPKPSTTQRREHLRAAQRHVHFLGVTSVGSMEYTHDVVNAYEPLRDALTLRCRITLLDRDWPLDCSFGKHFRHDDHLAVIGHKAFIDGTLGSRTARMLKDYSDSPGNRGMLVELAERGVLMEWAKHVASNGLSPSMHAIGDEAVRLALDVIDSIGNESHPRIEHAQQIDAADFPRFRGGRIASMQPLHKADDCRYVRKRMSESRLAGTFAFRKLMNAGAMLAFGSDWPVVSPDPILGMRTAITGVLFDGQFFGVDENLTVEETMRAYTADAARSLGMKDVGVLKTGAVGDLVMFDRDPFDTDWVNHPPRVVMTVAGSQVVYDDRAQR